MLGLAALPGRFPSDSGWCPGRFAPLPSGLAFGSVGVNRVPLARNAPRFGPSSPARLSSRFYSNSIVRSSTVSDGFSAMLTA